LEPSIASIWSLTENKSNKRRERRGRARFRNSAPQNTFSGDALAGVSLPKPSLPRKVGGCFNLTSKNSVSPQVTFLDVPILPVQIQVQATTGTVLTADSVIEIGPEIVPNFLTLGAVFKEYCITGFRGELRCVGNPVTADSKYQQGLLLCAIDEKDPTPPTFATIEDLPHLEAVISLTESPTRHLIEWKPQDLEDLQWQFMSAPTPLVPAWLKFWADPTTTFTITATLASQPASFALTGAVRVALRGLE